MSHLDSTVPATEECLRALEQARSKAQELLTRIQSRKDSRVKTEMKEGDRVWLEAKNLTIAGNKKLSPKRYGPFTIAKKISPVAFKLDLPPTMKIHDVFHIDLLLPYKETEAYGKLLTRPPPVIDNGEEEYEVESILKSRLYGSRRQLQYLVHWRGYPHSDDSWVSHKDVTNAPDLVMKFHKSNPAAAGRKV